MTDFKLSSKFKPTGDQQKAIDSLASGVISGKDYQVLLGVTGSGKSLTYDQQILVYEKHNQTYIPELLSIGKLFDNCYEGKNKNKQYWVPSINSSSGVQELKPVTSYQKHKSPKILYSVITKCGRKVKVTGDHNFYVLREGQMVLVQTSDIKTTDYLPIPRVLSEPKLPRTGILLQDWLPEKTYFNLKDLMILTKSNYKDVSRILGKPKAWHAYYAGEGLSSDWLPDLTNEREAALKKIRIRSRLGKMKSLYQQISHQLLSFIGLYIAEGHATSDYILMSVHEDELKERFLRDLKFLDILGYERRLNPGDFQISDVIWTKVFSFWCGNKASSKKFPPWFYSLNNKQLAILLSSMYDGDGYVDIKEVGYTTKSKQLASELVYSLLRYGIVARIRSTFKRATNSYMKKTEYNEVIVSGKENIQSFYKHIGFSLHRKQKKLANLISATIVSNTNVDLIPLDAKQLKEVRIGLGVTQKRLANAINCSRPLISLYESGQRIPSYTKAKNMVKFFKAVDKNKEFELILDKFHALTQVFWSPVKKIETFSVINDPYVYDISVEDNETFVAGDGGLYVHNTFTMANVIQKLQRPTLLISHNKTLAAQLYQEFRDFFPTNAVSYFVSYYDYYQPEAYIPSTDTYIEKDSDINELIDKLRLAATTNLLTRKDTIVVASVSCIYNIGSPREYGRFIFEFTEGMKVQREQIFDRLLDLQYERSDFGFNRGTFRVRGDSIDIYPAYQDEAVRIEMGADDIKRVSLINPVSGETVVNEKSPKGAFTLYPAKHFITDPAEHKSVFDDIRRDLLEHVKHLKSQGKDLEAHRIAQRVTYDLEMIQEVGYVKGIENYSRYFDGRKPGDSPFSLLDYFGEPYGKDWLVIVDESHITFPQVRGMFNGDKARKQTLVDYGFRLPAAMDNRPLKFDEFMRRIPNFIATSATPNEWEISMAGGSKDSKMPEYEKKKQTVDSRLYNVDGVVQQLLRPTGIPDPEADIRPTKNQVADVIEEIKIQIAKKQRTLVTTLTKRTAEELSTYLSEKGIKVHYLHSDVDTLDRTDILDDLRSGKYDVLVGINLLREGLDLPEVSLVAILDADKEGFLRSDVTLIQTMGRAARHVEGRVILYADSITGSMKRALDEIKRRREYQIAMNKKLGITPTSIQKPIREKLIEREEIKEFGLFGMEKQSVYEKLPHIDLDGLTPMDKKKLVKNLKKEMLIAAQDLNFELAAEIRDKVKEIEA